MAAHHGSTSAAVAGVKGGDRAGTEQQTRPLYGPDQVGHWRPSPKRLDSVAAGTCHTPGGAVPARRPIPWGSGPSVGLLAAIPVVAISLLGIVAWREAVERDPT